MIKEGSILFFDVVYDENSNYYEVKNVQCENGVIKEILVENFFYAVAYNKFYDSKEMLDQYAGKSVGDFLIDSLKHRKEMTESKRGKIYSLAELHDADVKIAIKNSENYKSMSI